MRPASVHGGGGGDGGTAKVGPASVHGVGVGCQVCASAKRGTAHLFTLDLCLMVFLPIIKTAIILKRFFIVFLKWGNNFQWCLPTLLGVEQHNGWSSADFDCQQ